MRRPEKDRRVHSLRKFSTRRSFHMGSTAHASTKKDRRVYSLSKLAHTTVVDIAFAAILGNFSKVKNRELIIAMVGLLYLYHVLR